MYVVWLYARRFYYYHYRASDGRLLFYSFNTLKKEKQDAFPRESNKKIIIMIMARESEKNTNTTNRVKLMDIQCWRRRFCMMRQRSQIHATDRNNRVAMSLKLNTIYFECFILTG